MKTLIPLKNAYIKRLGEISFKFTNFRHILIRRLFRLGYIRGFKISTGTGLNRSIVVLLKYTTGFNPALKALSCNARFFVLNKTSSTRSNKNLNESIFSTSKILKNQKTYGKLRFVLM